MSEMGMMREELRLYFTILSIFLLSSQMAAAGAYLGILRALEDGNTIPYAITHPPGYNGTGGEIIIDICVTDTFLDNYKLVGPLQEAIKTWNSLSPATGTCSNCITWEDVLPAGAFDVETNVLHELGHCAMGLDHMNMTQAAPFLFTNSSYTLSHGVSNIDDDNGVPGDFDDVQANAITIQDISWFRKMDNDPVKIDSTKIDFTTFSRSTAADLPVGHNYAASANKYVSQSLGFPDTQSVMYSRASPLFRNRHLTADDVNMVRMGMAGTDFYAGPPNDADDYTIRLRYQAICDADVEIKVEFAPFGGESGILGFCSATIGLSFPQGGVLKWHWTVMPPDTSDFLFITLNKDLEWDFGDYIFSSGFENGDLSDWSATLP